MPAHVVLAEAVLEMKGLAGYSPFVEFLDRSNEFYVTASLKITNGRRDRLAARIEGRSPDSADLALLRAYQKLFEIPEGYWLESTHDGRKWKFDPETEGWMKFVEDDL